ncbi:hotdog fold thioesterase [soil metagenome]
MAGPETYSSPFDDLIGTRIVEASGARVVARLMVTERLHQPTGLTHGGVFATVVETVASIGATVWLGERARSVAGSRAPSDGSDGDETAVGVSNHTDFLRGVRSGELTFEATPLQQGRTLQTWVVDVTDENGRRVAHGKVKLANISLP